MSNSPIDLTSLKKGAGYVADRLSFELSRVELQGVRVAESIDHHAN